MLHTEGCQYYSGGLRKGAGMELPRRFKQIMGKAFAGQAPTQRECAYLLGFSADSLEASVLRAVADRLSRNRFDGEVLLLGQVGVETGPCSGNCRFCAFGEAHTFFETTRRLPREDLHAFARALARGGDLFALFLMTTHDFEFKELLSLVDEARSAIPDATQIVVNTGDFEAHQAGELLATGVDGAYHVCRLREGIDTDLEPEQRTETLAAVRDSNLDLYCCCEPIGPEHTPEELAEQIFLGLEYEPVQHGAMRRIHVPGSPVADRGQIAELRLAQVVAVVALASFSCAETRSIAVHEPNLLGLTSGANAVFAEMGGNPRDTEMDTSGHLGLDASACRRLLCEAGFTTLRRGDGETVDIDLNESTVGPA